MYQFQNDKLYHLFATSVALNHVLNIRKWILNCVSYIKLSNCLAINFNKRHTVL